jgi:isoquinoline 1-oxidoreductase beta subunit
VNIEWDGGANANVSSASIAEVLKEGLSADQAFVHNQAGDSKAAIAGAAKKVEAIYAYPFQNHACMEPMNATALYTSDSCKVWCGTQNGEAALAAAAEASGLPVAKCDVEKLLLGGGFGRRGLTDYVRQAVAIAKEMPGTPVKLLWSREEDMLHGWYHPVMQAKLTGGLDASGNLPAWRSGSRDSRSSQECARRPWTRARTRSRSRVSGRPESTLSSTRSRTSRSTMRCATRTCRRASGAA